MTRKVSILGGFLRAAGVALGVVALLLATGEPGYTDDTDLLRKNQAKPYVMLILDTSGSMNLELGKTDWLPLNGDDPRSRIYAAKKALYEVFKGQSRVNYGFMTFDQNELRVRSKHWLYAPTAAPGWPLDYPKVPGKDGDEPKDDSFTLGKHLGSAVAGSCSSPLDLGNATERAMANRFSKLDEDGTATTELWVKKSPAVYRLRVSAPSIGAEQALGDPSLTLLLEAALIEKCVGGGGGEPRIAATYQAKVPFRLVGEFLMEDAGNRFKDDGSEGGGNDTEDHAGFWDWQDAVASSHCSDKSPFTGKGIESNYDDPYFAPPSTPDGFPDALEPYLTREDEYCSGSGMVCDDLKFRTSIDSKQPQYRELDRGDFLPYHWDIPNHQEVLRRLNPNHGTGAAPDYGASAYFEDGPGVTGYLPLKNPSQRPVIATGETPFGKAINDYRCWYLGPNVGPSGKCRTGPAKLAFDTGWEQVAGDERLGDPDFACRRPYAILITDGEDTCAGENPTADVNDFDGVGVKTWIINLGGRDGEKRLNSILKTAKASIITITPGGGADALGAELRKILGVIESESRSFAAAAVPSVQTEDEQKIFLTSFTPLNSSSVWAGRTLGFLKPLPRRTETDAEGVTQLVPDTSRVCTATDTEECFLWDAGEVLKTQINADPFGPGEDQRRVFYPQAPSGATPLGRQPLERSDNTGAGDPLEEDLWRGLDIPFVDGVVASEENARSQANSIIDFTYRLKTGLLDPNDKDSEVQFILGDNFHAEPVVIAGPSSNQLFVQDFKNYRDFAKKHRFRRKVLITGTNDGMLHFFDAGIPRKKSSGGRVEVEYDRGSGKELLAFVPRSVLPALAAMADGTEHVWSVDGGLSVADVYIDPKHNGTPSDANREWRTVLAAGLRRGGETVYALDITQPDDLKEVTITEPVPETVLIPDVADSARLPECWNTYGDGNRGCDGDVLYPVPMWEFDDSVEVDGERVRLDEDDNGETDFAQSWSRPNLGRIQVREGGSVVDKFVAIFGGGTDPEKPNLRGDWLYIVDIETGRRIYKSRLDGSAPSEPAAVDTNQDGLLDRVYIGTTRGFLYRLDLGPDASGDLPLLEDYTLFVEVGGSLKAVAGEKRITDRTPRIVFDNVQSGNGLRLPFYFRPSVIFSPLLSPNYALALGDGDRENLWSRAGTAGRFYVFVDDTDKFGGPITSSDLEPIGASDLATSDDYLFEPASGNRPGWYIVLEEHERIVSDAFALSGIVVFSTFIPDVRDEADPNDSDLRLCSRRGDSRAFAVLTTNGNGMLFDKDSNRTRSMTVNTLVSRAFADLAISKAKPSGDGVPPGEEPPPELPPNMQLVMDELKKLFPSNCRFANYRIDIRAVAADTEVVDIAPVPVCLIEKNWREF